MGDDSSRLVGEWWLPDDEDKRCAGEIEFGPGRFPRLTVIGGWSEPTPVDGTDGRLYTATESYNAPERAAVHGMTLDREAVTLLDAQDMQSGLTIGGLSSGRQTRLLEGGCLVVGDWLHSSRELSERRLVAFHSAAANAMRGMNLEAIFWEEMPDAHGGFDLKWRTVPKQTATLPCGTTIELGVQGSQLTPRFHNGRFEQALAASPVFGLELSETEDLETVWRSHFYPLDALVRFAANRSGGWQELSAQRPPMSRAELHLLPLVERPSEPLPPRHAPNFYLDHPGTDFHQLVNRWFELWDETGPTIEVGLRALSEPRTIDRARQLALALEGLSSADSKKSAFRPHWKKIQRKIKKAVPKELRKAAIARVSSIIQPTLAERIEAVCHEIEACGTRIPVSVAAAVDDVRRVRNAASHPRNRGGPDFHQVMRANVAADALLRCLLMLRLPAATSEVQERIMADAQQKLISYADE